MYIHSETRASIRPSICTSDTVQLNIDRTQREGQLQAKARRARASHRRHASVSDLLQRSLAGPARGRTRFSSEAQYRRPFLVFLFCMYGRSLSMEPWRCNCSRREQDLAIRLSYCRFVTADPAIFTRKDRACAGDGGGKSCAGSGDC